MIPKMPYGEQAVGTSAPSRGGFSAAWAISAIAFATALAASIALVADQVAHLVQLPGCSTETSACEELSRGPWGSILGLPLSTIGTAYFTAVLIAWCAALLHGVHPVVRWVLRAGAVGSLFYLGVMVAEGQICPWCMCVHISNLIGVLCGEMVRRDEADFGRTWVGVAGGVGCLMLAGLGMWHATAKQEVAAEAEASFDRTADAILAASVSPERSVSENDSSPEEPSTSNAGAKSEVNEHDLFPADSEDVNSGANDSDAGDSGDAAPVVGPKPTYHPLVPPEGFTGRWRKGPESAVMRIVVWSDFQCPSCQKFDRVAMDFVERNPDVSLSIRHMPICSDCNPLVPLNKHKNACRAALAAEAAGMLGGEEAFWKMSEWLLRKKAQFTDDEVQSAARAFQIAEPEVFGEVMDSEEAMARVKGDIEAARRVGMASTPLVFINGQELENWNVTNALDRIVEKLRAAGASAATAAVDHPKSGVQRYFDKYFKETPDTVLSRDNERWAIGPEDAPVKVVLFTDRLGPHAPIMLNAVLKLLEARDDVRVVPRHFPLDKTFATWLSGDAEDYFPGDATAALATEAAGRLAGVQGYWKMHDWIVKHRESFDSNDLYAAANELGIDPQKLALAMQAQATSKAIAEDMKAGVSIGMRFGPKVFVNDRLLDGVAANPEVLAQVVEALHPKSSSTTDAASLN